jgi:hypothetical protein
MKRMDVFEKHPRIHRIAKTDETHHGAVEYAWREHEAALQDRNSHHRYGQPIPRRQHNFTIHFTRNADIPHPGLTNLLR